MGISMTMRLYIILYKKKNKKTENEDLSMYL